MRAEVREARPSRSVSALRGAVGASGWGGGGRRRKGCRGEPRIPGLPVAQRHVGDLCGTAVPLLNPLPRWQNKREEVFLTAIPHKHKQEVPFLGGVWLGKGPIAAQCSHRQFRHSQPQLRLQEWSVGIWGVKGRRLSSSAEAFGGAHNARPEMGLGEKGTKGSPARKGSGCAGPGTAGVQSRPSS